MEFSNKREQTSDTCKTMDSSQNMTLGEKPYTHSDTYVMSPLKKKKVIQQAKFIHDGKKKRLKELLVSVVETGGPLREF